MIKDDNTKRFVTVPLQRRGKGSGNIGVAVWDDETRAGFVLPHSGTLPLRPSEQHMMRLPRSERCLWPFVRKILRPILANSLPTDFIDVGTAKHMDAVVTGTDMMRLVVSI